MFKRSDRILQLYIVSVSKTSLLCLDGEAVNLCAWENASRVTPEKSDSKNLSSIVGSCEHPLPEQRQTVIPCHSKWQETLSPSTSVTVALVTTSIPCFSKVSEAATCKSGPKDGSSVAPRWSSKMPAPPTPGIWHSSCHLFEFADLFSYYGCIHMDATRGQTNQRSIQLYNKSFLSHLIN